MFPRRSPSSSIDDLPSSVVPAAGPCETGTRVVATLPVPCQSHPKPFKPTLSDSAFYLRNGRRQSQGRYHPFFQQLNSRKSRFFANKPIVHAEARLTSHRRRQVGLAKPPSGTEKCGLYEAGISFRISNMLRKTQFPCRSVGADVRSVGRRCKESGIACNNLAHLPSLVARRIYGGNVAGDVSATGGCNFQPRRSTRTTLSEPP